MQCKDANSQRRSPRIIFHCGSSKNGSTAIQSALVEEGSRLASQGVGVLCVETRQRTRFEDGFCIDDIRLGVCRAGAFCPDPDGTTTGSLADVFELYKIIREARDLNRLLQLEAVLLGSISSALMDCSVVVLSAEAFETSLCLRDPLFKRLICKLSAYGDVELVYYQPDPAKHAISAWQQWGWIDRYSYANWLSLYIRKTNWKCFFERRGQPYWGNLIDVGGWVDYWSFDSGISLSLYSDVSDTCEHFFTDVLGVGLVKIDELTSTQRNVGWPRSLLKSFPCFYDFISGDYVKYEVLRQLLIDKERSSGVTQNSSYQVLYILTRIALLHTGYWSGGVGSDVMSRDDQDIIFQQIDDFFRDLSVDEVSKVYRYLADAMYHLHVESLGG